MQPQLLETTISRLEHGVLVDTRDYLAIEEPLEIRLNYVDETLRCEKTLSITMRTPGNDAELAAGFLFTEGVLRSPAAVTKISAGGTLGDNVVRVCLADDAPVVWPHMERHFYATSSCGVCGKTSLDALEVKGLQSIPREGFHISSQEVVQLAARLRIRQSVFEQTGGLHAAALFSESGELISLREDVGRHNAVDKLLGSEFLAGTSTLHHRLLFLSGRASFELVQKALVAGIPMIAAVGAPSSLAVKLARAYNMTLLGFVREGRFNIYHGAWRVTGDET